MDLVQKLWERLVYRVISGDFPHPDFICGIRMLDKSMEKRENIFRIEVWVKMGDDRIAFAKEIREYLIEHYAQEIHETGSASLI